MRIIVSLTLAAAVALAETPVDFQRQVRPILSDNCFHCHGPDRTTRMANLRLDTREGAFAPRKQGAAIVPGQPAASLILERIRHQDPARVMPPPQSHKKISDQQQQILTRWIAQGAPWQEHWAFQQPAKPSLPTVRDTRWPSSPLDQLLLARIEAAGLTPAPEADRRTLARRLALDLTGLPPQPADVEAFVTDPAPDAYEKLVDRFLASPQYGEHRARFWLDAARYADTHGLHVDNYREMWPYRDWVIQAFNRNLRFDQFVLWQVAGDLLPNRTMEQQIASGFQRCNVTTNEGGVIPDEVQAMYDKDRADTTGAVFLGMTVGCASCHDHKFDPISQKDFYALTAFYRNTLQRPLDGNIYDTPPVLIVPRPADEARWQSLPADEAAARTAIESVRAAAAPAFHTWFTKGRHKKVKLPVAGELFRLPAGELTFDAKQTRELPSQPLFARNRPFSIAVRFFLPKTTENLTVLSQLERYPEDKARGIAVEVNDRRPFLRLVGDDNKAIQVRGSNDRRLAVDSWHHVTFTYDGSGRRDSLALFVNGEAVPYEGANESFFDLMGEIETKAPLRLGGDGNKRFFAGGKISDLRLYPRALGVDEARTIALWPELTRGDRAAAEHYYLVNVDPGARQAYQHLAALTAERLAIRRRAAITHVMQEKTNSLPMSNILYRGQYDQPRDKVEPAVPGVLPPLPANAPKNRLGLAQWLVDANNPLTARVTVNRFWQEIFGTGIVKTADDFGSQGEAPTHPELLDWLAIEFRESGWDVKALLRLMVTSAAYRQAAIATPDKLQADPDNRLLARGPRFRMDGEMIRDYALAASGLLTAKIGGPSVKPYQPDNVWETVAMDGSNTRFYKRDSGENLYRRSLYTFWKRSAPPANMEIFNAPTRETCTVRRERTNTPLQALVTMNDPQFVEAARALAQRALQAEKNNPAGQLQLIARTVLARPLDEREQTITQSAYRDYLRHYDSYPADARKLLAVGESKADASLPPADIAALTMVTNQLLNLDEVVTK
ncbi:MAG: DUF1553 domain-containing protein [Acidobacteria bacterium]|nr:DUF1553 domain-containing protein [Acidobacteriota bacterium]